ncbi:Uncharacterised protein [uncultured archaeon]|nr:Uncharacterised protein [uncultured archaeon]
MPFSALRLICIMYAGFKRIEPGMDIGGGSGAGVGDGGEAGEGVGGMSCKVLRLPAVEIQNLLSPLSECLMGLSKISG